MQGLDSFCGSAHEKNCNATPSDKARKAGLAAIVVVRTEQGDEGGKSQPPRKKKGARQTDKKTPEGVALVPQPANPNQSSRKRCASTTARRWPEYGGLQQRPPLRRRRRPPRPRRRRSRSCSTPKRASRSALKLRAISWTPGKGAAASAAATITATPQTTTTC